MVRLTAHPLQRIGAYALACLAADGQGEGAGRPDPAALTADDVVRAAAVMTKDVVVAALGRDTKAAEGFFLKSSLSLFPNSPMFHPSNAKRTDREIAKRVRYWRRCPAGTGPSAACVLCGEPAVGFYGKMDVPLVESAAYRNTTPRGHDGTALCWECLCCFYALPYATRMTGGPCLALHSWDEAFIAGTVAQQVAVARRVIEIGADAQDGLRAREVLALRALRGYAPRLRAGVELLVFSNNNRGPSLAVYGLDQPMAEWLRRTMQKQRIRKGFRLLLRAHRTTKEPGYVGLARNAFRSPERIPGACARYLMGLALHPAPLGGSQRDDVVGLAALCFDFAEAVMVMDKDDLDEIRQTGRRVATLLAAETGGGRLLDFYARFKNTGRLRSWLQRAGVEWMVRPVTATPGSGRAGPLMTTRGFELLFDPDFENPSWFHRQMLLVAVVEALAEQGWRPAADAEVEAEVPELDGEDQQFVDDDREGDR